MLYIQPASLQFTAPSPSGQADPAREKEALKELEQFFLYTLLGEMRKTIDEGGLYESGGAKPIFDDMMDDAMATQMAESGQMGVAKAIEDQLHAADIRRSIESSLKIPLANS